MADTNYLIVAFDVEKPMHIGNGMNKQITRGEFRLLMEDFPVELELNQVPYGIESTRSFSVEIGGCQHLVAVVDVKRK